MKAPFRLAVFLTTAVAGMAAVPIRAADAVLPPAKPRIFLGVEDAWSLRQAGAAARQEMGAPAGARTVRLVYPPLIEPR